MSKIVFLVGYNNYFNRRCKRESDINGYIANSERAYSIESSNFNVNDGIYAEHTINWPFGGDKSTPDYCVVCPDEYTIGSRWFVSEWRKNRGGQFVARLRRDVIADFFDSIINSPCFIERGPLNFGSKLIFNPEGFSLNRIKRKETLLKDETGTQWIVGYMDRDTPETDVQSIFHEEQYPTAQSLGIVFNQGEDPTSGGTAKALIPDSIMPEMRLVVRTPTTQGYQFFDEIRVKCVMESPRVVSDDYFGFKGRWGTAQGRAIIDNVLSPDDAALAFRDVLRDSYSETERAALYTDLTNGIESIKADLTTYKNIGLLNQSPIIRHNNKYYKVGVSSSYSDEEYADVASSGNFSAAYYDLEYFYGKWKAKTSVSQHVLIETVRGVPYDVGFRISQLDLVFTEVTPPGVAKVKISSNRKHLSDAPYDMFCIPFSETNLALAQSIALALGGGGGTSHIKDMQILPFCPARFILDDEGTSGLDYSPIKIDGNEVSRLYYCRESSAAFIINVSLKMEFRDPDEAMNTKLANECDMYRLTSPNYSSSFEFSVAKNGGVDAFKASFTYRPFSPYIHVQPIFKNMYGDVNNDVRGLILSGDYSVDMLSDAFTNYQIANKNYENIFNTQIKRLDDLHVYERINAIAGAVAGTVGGASQGLASGAAIGGGMGAAVGAVVGGTASAVGGILDYQNREAMFNINRRYSFDMYNYGLGNVQALPDTLTKVSAYNVDNKYFPIVEFYSCTEEEVEIVKNKLRYQSFAVMGISTISKLIGGVYDSDKFVKGQMIRIENQFFEDKHMADEIYSEIAKGVYF